MRYNFLRGEILFMKSKIITCFLIFIFCVSISYAKVQKFGNFSVDVPIGWDANLQGSTLVIKSHNTNASIAVAFNRMGDADFTDIVERLYLQMDGTDLEQDKDGDYSFNFRNSSGVDGVVLVTMAEDYYLVLSMTGVDEDNKDIDTILDSIDWNDE